MFSFDLFCSYLVLVHSSLSSLFAIFIVVIIDRRQNMDNDIDDDDGDNNMEGTKRVKRQKQITRNAKKKKKKKKKKNCNNPPLTDYPHRLEALTNLGVKFLAYNPNNNNDDDDHINNSKSKNWEIMFQKFVNYKEEHGTIRFPSDEQCAATKNEEFIALKRWVKGQVLTFRYCKKNKKERKDSESVRRLREIGFDFEKWFAKPGKKGMTKATNGRKKIKDVTHDTMEAASAKNILKRKRTVNISAQEGKDEEVLVHDVGDDDDNNTNR